MTLVSTPDQAFYSAFSKNVTILNSTRRKINMQINDSLRREDDFSLEIYTNIYLLIYSAWTEASLVKLVHTPFGFTTAERRKILDKKEKDVLNKWKKCVNTAFSKFRKNGSEIPNKKNKIHKLLDDFLKNQANIRNKIAHGQWVYPLFADNMAHDLEAETYLSFKSVIQIDIWFEVFKEISEIVQGLIDARPKNNFIAHYNHYYNKLVNIQNIINERSKWTIADKKARLKLKPRK